MIKNKFLFFLNILSISTENINIAPIFFKNKRHIPITIEFCIKEDNLSERQINIINIFNQYKKIPNKNKDSFLFDSFGEINNFSHILNIVATIVFFIISFVSAILIISHFNKNIGDFLQKVEFIVDKKMYQIYFFFFLEFLAINNILNNKFNNFNILWFLVYLSIMPILIKLVVIFVNFVFKLTSKENKEDVLNFGLSNFKNLYIIEVIFAIQYFLYWKFYTYPINEKYFKGIKPKFEEFEKYTILKEDQNNIVYISEDKKEEFKNEILSL